ncbi:MAG: hypothetical protein A3D24_02185 [Candidatus Blackburnbacteria bacterium RIFCSPHIGHO2_02_FULL_39_13]|uniref:Bacterial Ig domain-containing protein n=1 Tax=Candidatus Blackburnbacteria bacterium RIFCSPLOWO2_01_FULL_40_20 TaxID=1797519 RepID=A0A1G1VE53_9BACT|nr:MAG: Bacillopeptidase F [Microgenomates group bacterium GW2011_GWA2_39_19]OGY06904.1 MAG: hypothetical protein A2694_03935 [Candidatus Blackburnbacteria bacterium RIFCSPHIGHO2_01_FULL_40_17]OGY09206.1 MAG: hypothetical protein A3D24_02185 [Candidatus Blackburnbacteria bacterium RIFCSPHIGHO2_02_FULL_39_13]OGY13556.1 MAG: hypothetical protein A3A77_04170 [Candidatus Blackburnbacteria bacterium RIFCSPLOWO2_01_FULL_40_20]HBL52208.1 hypothetical protein [Candidatus Blackburnbacteria bacterium]
MISRREKVQEKRMAKSGIVFLLTSILLLALLIIVGIPTLGKIASMVNNKPVVQQDDKTPPTPPQFDDLPRYTKEDKVTINGRAPAGSILKIFRNDKKVREIKIDDTSLFTAEIPLEQKLNSIYATSTDERGNESGDSRTSIVNYIAQPPSLEITRPQDKQTFYGDDKDLRVEGKTDNSDVSIKVNDRIAIVAGNGVYSQNIILSEGENSITVVATDLAQNTTEKKISVTYSP